VIGALNAGRFPPQKILAAAKARYIGLTLRALNSRSDPSAPFVYHTENLDGARPAVRYASSASVKDLLVAAWAESVAAHWPNVPTANSVLQVIRAVVGQITPVISFCCAGGHDINSSPYLDMMPPRLHYLGYEPQHLSLFQNYLQEHDVPYEYRKINYTEIILRNISICRSHRIVHCSMCAVEYTASRLALPDLLTWHAKSCLTCRNRDFLCLKTPPKYSPASLKQWRTSVRQFVDVL
jgi:hypothetical protein